MRTWVSVSVGLLDDAAFMQLCPAHRVVWFQLLMEAAKQEGQLPGLRELAWRWRMHEAELEETLAWYLDAKWLLASDDGYLVAKWEKHQRPLKKDATAAERMRRYRKRLKVAKELPETPVTDAVTRNDTRNDRNVTPPYMTGQDITVQNIAPNGALVEQAPRTPKETDRQRLIRLEKLRDVEGALVDVWNLYRYLWHRGARNETFWGATKNSKKARAAIADVIRTLGAEEVMQGMIIASREPYWRKKGGMQLDNIGRLHNLEGRARAFEHAPWAMEIWNDCVEWAKAQKEIDDHGHKDDGIDEGDRTGALL